MTDNARAEIMTVGFVDTNDQPQGWLFNCHEIAAAVSITTDGVLYGGWSVDELRAISEGLNDA